jgi:hypothetical protein
MDNFSDLIAVKDDWNEMLRDFLADDGKAYVSILQESVTSMALFNKNREGGYMLPVAFDGLDHAVAYLTEMAFDFNIQAAEGMTLTQAEEIDQGEIPLRLELTPIGKINKGVKRLHSGLFHHTKTKMH